MARNLRYNNCPYCGKISYSQEFIINANNAHEYIVEKWDPNKVYDDRYQLKVPSDHKACLASYWIMMSERKITDEAKAEREHRASSRNSSNYDSDSESDDEIRMLMEKSKYNERGELIGSQKSNTSTGSDPIDIPVPNRKGGMRGGATEITDDSLEKKLVDATAPYNEKAARNAENFAKASIEVGKAIIAQLKLDPFAFINNAKNLGIKISEITKEGIFLLFPGNDAMEEPIERLVESGTKLYFLPVRILGTIAITIFLSMFDVFIPLKFLEKIPGLKPFIDLVMKYSAIIPTMIKGINIPNLSLGSLIDSDVMDASFLKDGTKYEYKSKKGGRKKRRTRRKKRRKN